MSLRHKSSTCLRWAQSIKNTKFLQDKSDDTNAEQSTWEVWKSLTFLQPWSWPNQSRSQWVLVSLSKSQLVSLSVTESSFESSLSELSELIWTRRTIKQTHLNSFKPIELKRTHLNSTREPNRSPFLPYKSQQLLIELQLLLVFKVDLQLIWF